MHYDTLPSICFWYLSIVKSRRFNATDGGMDLSFMTMSAACMVAVTAAIASLADVRSGCSSLNRTPLKNMF